MLGTKSRRFVAGFASAAVAIGLLGLVAPSATAAEADLGDLTLAPASGPATDYVTVITPTACPAGTVNFKVSLNGPGITSTTDNNLNGVSSYASATPAPTGTGISVQAVNTLKDLFQANGVTAPSGAYTINLRCQNGNGGVIYGDFLATINLASSGTAFEGTYTYVPPTPDGVATTTTLAQPASPIKAGTATTLTATVAPSATGTVQFKDGATNLGAAVDVVSGTATKSGVALAAGSHSLTAVFTSADTNAFLSSTSTPKTVLVAGVPAISGTPAVGKTLTCLTSAGGAPTYAWLVNGSVQSAYKARTALVPAAWYTKSVTCRATYGAGVDQTSPAKKIGLGAKLVAKTKPTVKGTAKVGKKLTCSAGTWSPTAASYKYKWLRSGKTISGKTTSTYKASKKDKGKKVSCQVTAVKTGYASGVATSSSRKIS